MCSAAHRAPSGTTRGTNNSAGSFNNPAQLLLFLSPAAAKPGREAVRQDAFNGAPEDDYCGVDGEGHAISQVHAQELHTVDPLHSITIYGKRCVVISLKWISISLVLSTLILRLWDLHHTASCSTTFL